MEQSKTIDASGGGEQKSCHWGGGNDIIWCSTCGAEYAYAKGEVRPDCPLASAPPAPTPEAGSDLAKLSAAATNGPWFVESERSDGAYGSGEDAGEGYDAFAICTEAQQHHGAPGVLFDSHNSTTGSVEEEHDEDTFHVWDATAKANATFVAAIVNAYRSGRLVEASPSPPPAEDLAGQGEPSTETKMVCVVPVGWRLVPERPTSAMCAAGAEENVESDLENRIYEAMISNAPPAPLTAIAGGDSYKIAANASDASKIKSILAYILRGIQGGNAHKPTAELLRTLAEFPAYIATVPGLEPHHLRERASFLEDAEREVAKLKSNGGV